MRGTNVIQISLIQLLWDIPSDPDLHSQWNTEGEMYAATEVILQRMRFKSCLYNTDIKIKVYLKKLCKTPGKTL